MKGVFVMIVIIDYGMGNLKSVKNALNFLGLESKISSDLKDIQSADALILPGVGAFPDAMDTIEKLSLDKIIKEVYLQCSSNEERIFRFLCMKLDMFNELMV